MWQSRPSRQFPTRPPRRSRPRLWLTIGAVIVVGLLLATILSNLVASEPGSDSTANQPESTAVATSDTGFMDSGYSDLANDGGSSFSTPSFSGLWFGILVPLVIVVVVIYAALRGLRYLNTRIASSSSQTQMLEALDTLPLNQNGAIHLVRMGTRVLIVGASTGQLSLLTELDPDDASILLEEHRHRREAGAMQASSALRSFRDAVNTRLGRASERADDVAADGDADDEGDWTPDSVREDGVVLDLSGTRPHTQEIALNVPRGTRP